MTHYQRQSLLNQSCNANTIIFMQDELERYNLSLCEFCNGAKHEHQCTSCDCNISAKSCEENEGLCFDCAHLMD